MSENTPPRIGRPQRGPKEYIYRGFAGFPETLRILEADAILQEILGTITIDLAISTLKAQPSVLRAGYQYDSVRDHLERLTKLEDPPLPAIVALWAKALYGK